jgi:hypothetical protein
VNCTNIYFVTLPSELNYILASKVPNETPISLALNVPKLTYGHFRFKIFSEEEISGPPLQIHGQAGARLTREEAEEGLRE